MTPESRARLTAHLRESEGFRSKPYLDSVGVLSIGFGRNLDHVGITREEAEVLLANDIDTAVAACTRAFPWFAALDDVRQTVIADMAFNLGQTKLLGFKATLAAVASGDYQQAATHMLDSLWAKQVGRRAQRLAQMMRTGEDTE